MEKRCANCPRTKYEECKDFNLSLPSFGREEIEQDLIQALNLFFDKDYDLINRDIHERTITSHLVQYFIALFGEKYNGYNIDSEYNRNGRDSKYYYREDSKKFKRAIPDIIIHKRNCNKYNLLYLELKKGFHDSHDKEKIQKFMLDRIIGNRGGNIEPTIYAFRHGVSIAIVNDKVSLGWYIKEDDTWIYNSFRYKNNRLEKVS